MRSGEAGNRGSGSRHPIDMRRASIGAVALLMVAGCASPEVQVPIPDEQPLPTPILGFVMADVEGEPMSVESSDLRQVVEGNTAFAFRLFRAVAGEDNLILSPNSVAAALAMTYAGARGETAEEMEATLNITLPPEVFAAATGQMLATLTAEPPEPDEGEGEPFALEITNSAWAQAGYPLLGEFLETLATNYRSGMNLVDFIGATEEARLAINAAVEEDTHGRITDLIPEGALTELTRLVLVNAIWFKGTWAREFSPEATEDGPFTLLDGTEVSVPTMHGSIDAAHVRGDGYQTVVLPYRGGASMVVVLPDSGRFAEVAAALNPEWLAAATDGDPGGEVDLALPRFEFRRELSLVGALQSLGMETAFEPPDGDDGADFSGIDGERLLYVSDVIHQAFVSVDEEGTEAAAATAVVFEGVAGGLTRPVVDVDRPFLFLIRHDASGEILFIGQVTDPR